MNRFLFTGALPINCILITILLQTCTISKNEFCDLNRKYFFPRVELGERINKLDPLEFKRIKKEIDFGKHEMFMLKSHYKNRKLIFPRKYIPKRITEILVNPNIIKVEKPLEEIYSFQLYENRKYIIGKYPVSKFDKITFEWKLVNKSWKIDKLVRLRRGDLVGDAIE